MFGEVGRDPENRIVIITGTGDAFIPPKPMTFSPDWQYTAGHWQRALEHGRDLIRNIIDVRAPVIAAVNGPVHTHAEIALVSDIVICTPDTSFRDLPHVLEQMVPGDGMHIVMPLLLGKLRASYFLFTGQEIGADEAKARGLVNEIVPRDALLERARALPEQLLRNSDTVLRYTKRLVTQEVRRLIDGQLDLGLALEGIAAWGTSWADWESPVGRVLVLRTSKLPAAPSPDHR
jgi:enoyl-CoA hydratase/carnithine racemase